MSVVAHAAECRASGVPARIPRRVRRTRRRTAHVPPARRPRSRDAHLARASHRRPRAQPARPLTKPKRRTSPVLLAMLFLVSIAGAAYGGWMWAQRSRRDVGRAAVPPHHLSPRRSAHRAFLARRRDHRLQRGVGRPAAGDFRRQPRRHRVAVPRHARQRCAGRLEIRGAGHPAAPRSPDEPRHAGARAAGRRHAARSRGERAAGRLVAGRRRAGHHPAERASRHASNIRSAR